MRIEKLMKKIIVIVVSFAVINSTVTSSVALSALGLYNLYKTEDTTNVTVDDTNQTEEITNENTLQTQPGGGTLFQNDAINIYNIAQLRAIGTNKIVYTNDNDASTFGTGSIVVDDDNNVVTYSSSANYRLMNDIPLDINDLWQLPEDFSGKFVSEDITENPVYDKTTDTMYVYHSYQLQTIASSTSDQEPVMSKDANPELYGMGQITYIDDNNYVTYSKEHNYVLSKLFTGTRPSMISTVYADNNAKSDDQKAGRDYVGQIIKEIDGIEYILIGSKGQLLAIGKKEYGLLGNDYAQVTGPAYSYDSRTKQFTLEYCGDADLELNSNSNENNNGKIIDDGADNGLSPVKWYGVDENGRPSLDCKGKQTTGKYYAPDENYIIFRDIDLENKEWTPLMFSGIMIGAKSVGGNKLWGDTGINEANQQVTISNISINQNEKIEVKNQSGVGFFGTLKNDTDILSGDYGKQVIVKNINLANVSVSNNATSIKTDSGLVEFLLRLVSGLLFGALDALLDSDTSDETAFATGAFVGRIYGDVLIEKCSVENIEQYTTKKGMAGGFAGIVEGVTKYGPLQNSIELGLVKLEDLLNIVPFLDVGTLIKVLIDGGALSLGELIPTGYLSPKIVDCSIKNTNNLTINSNGNDFVGGFVGKSVGAEISNSSVESSNISINGKNMVGGFSGFTANGELVGLLDNLGVDLINTIRTNSFLLGCEVKTNNLNLIASENYVGGITGALANSISVDNKICELNSNETTLVNIKAKNYAGGIAGCATLGQAVSLGDFYDGKKDLVTLISKILDRTLSGDEAAVLLSLVGISPSVIAGNSVLTDSLSISVTEKYAGGIVGQGDGVKIVEVNELDEVSKVWELVKKNLHYQIDNSSENQNTIKYINSITGSSYVGGIAGNLLTASPVGILNNTVGAIEYLPFKVSGVEVSGMSESLTITASQNYAGGAIGQGIGGDVENVRLEGINTISAKNYAGGFVASAGTGSLVDAGGLDILGLGLIEIKDLLSLAKAVSFNANNCTVNGISDGFTVKTTGDSTTTSGDLSYYAGGFVGENSSANLTNCSVKNLKYVSSDEQSGRAGGFAAEMSTGGLAGIAEDSNQIKLPGILNVEGLVSAVKYLIPNYQNCSVAFVSNNDLPQVEGAIAGGFIGNMGAGTLDNTDSVVNYAVKDLDYVLGTYYAGGFAGKATAGGFVNSGNGIKLLDLINLADITDLISVLNVYIPKIINANVTSNIGLMVKAEDTALVDANSGSAGGFIGYGSGVQISNSNVEKLRHIDNSSLLGENPSSELYYNEDLKYAVEAKKNAGGYAGKLDIGNAASVGNGISLLGDAVTLANLTEVLDVVASKVQNSSVKGDIGGYAIRANGSQNSAIIGNAGGFVGAMYGSALQNADADNFEYIIGQETAGGYAGRIEPGNVANVVSNTDVLGGLISANGLLSVVSAYIPMIYNSQASCVPCGGYVIANGKSDKDTLRGVAGGYVGYNLGGRIEGKSSREWKDIVNGTKVTPSENSTFELKENSIIRLRLVEGYEFAGGFTGKLETANVADTGNLNVLYGLIELSNPIQALGAVYPTETNTATYGPLKKLDTTTWNNWYNAIGKDGAYGNWMKEVSSKDELQKLIDLYAYGYDVIATRSSTAAMPTQGGVAGGYVGRMDGGVITNADANDLKNATAYRSTGGFAGEMITAGVANVSGIEIAGIDVLGDLGGLLNVFVPVINGSSISGYKSGMIIKANGIDQVNNEGNAGGFVGSMIGGQINVEGTTNCEVNNIKLVQGSYGIGGFAGSILPGSAAKVNSASNQGLLNKILKSLIGSVDDLAKLLNATVATVKHATVNSNTAAGFVVDGKYADNQYAYAAGGFAGNVNGAVIGELKNEPIDNPYDITVSNVQSVIGGEHVGGFLGLGDVAAVAQVSSEADINILQLIKLGAIDVLDAFRTYVYSSSIEGGKNGLKVSANSQNTLGTGTSTVYTGNAGGFAGSLLNGSIKKSTVSNLNSVKALNYTGGFVGHMGKSGTVDVDNINVLDKLIGLNAGVFDVFGSHVENCIVNGLENNGFVVRSDSGSEEIAGGFVGNADLAKINESNVGNLKQVFSGKTAGGFVGETSYAYLISADAQSTLLNAILVVVNKLLDYLYVDDLQQLGAIEINLGEKALKLTVLAEDSVLKVNLLGLQISVSLVKGEGEHTDVAKITIGDSYIEVPCHESDNGNHISEEDKNNISIGIIKANRTTITYSTVDGIETGYDVFGSGATKDKLGNNKDGYTGGFVGYNNEGLFENNTMLRADKIKGAPDNVNGFSGKVSLKSVYDFNTVYGIEGHNNIYHVYRVYDNDKLNYLCRDVKDVVTTNGELLGDKQVLLATFTPSEDEPTPKYYDYQINHLNSYVYDGKVPTAVRHLDKGSDWQEAYQTTEFGLVKFNADVYVTNGELNLMDGSINDDTVQDPVKDEGAMQDPCSDEMYLKIQKLWVDDNNKDNTRPDHVTIKLNRYILDEFGEKVYDETFTNIEKTINLSNADYDTNSWSYIIPKNELSLKDNDGNRYYYEVVEEPVNGYLTIYEQSQDGYTFYITNYRTTSIMTGDSVVIDYGLPVVVDVMENDRIANDSELQGTLTGVTKINRDGETDGVNSEVYSQDAVTSNLWTETEADAASCTGNYGKAEILDTNSDGKNESIKYTPTNMQMDNFEKLLYAVNVDIKDDANTESNTKLKIADGQNYVYSTLDIIPATQIYYEDNFTTVKYNNGAAQWMYIDDNGNISEENNDGAHDISNTSLIQDTNRPGMRQITKALDDSTEKTYDVNYGFDTSYINDNTFGAGSAHYVIVDENTDKTNFPSLEFTFTGTGFDVISLTNNQTGTIIARVYKADKNGVVAENAKPIRSWIVDTYYGYRFDTEKGEWVIDNSVDTPLYQVPIIRSDDNSMGPLDYGTYKVTITLTYSKGIDHTNKDENNENNEPGYRYYFDGVRIYGSANKNNSDYQVIEDAYIADHENNPEYLEIRDMLIARGEDPTLEEVPKPGFGFIDGSIAEVSLSDYINYGPKHETYLKPGQAISFYLESDYKPDAVHIGAKVASGSNLNLGLQLMNKENDSWVSYKKRTDIVLNSTGELFRNLSNQCVWEEIVVDGKTKYRTRYPIVISNNTQVSEQDENNGFQNIISLTQIKLTGKPTNTTTEKLGFRVYSNYDSIEAAYSVVRSQFEKKITVKYVDLNGNNIAQDEIKKVEVNKIYDVSDLTNKEINGYSIVEVKGDVTGVADSDKEVTVVYGKNYQLTVNYVDLQGNQLKETYVEKLVEGNTYDLTEASKQEINGYSIVEVKGDVTGVADSDKEVTVVYGRNYQLTVNYVDLQGNQLKETYVEKVVEGNTYDLTKASKQEINGYSIVEVKGDVTGVTDSNKEITVVYGQNHQLTVQYLDENGNKLAKDYTVIGIEGNNYDLSSQINIKIDGYKFDKVIGDLVTGTIDQDKVIKVIYLKETNGDITNNDTNKPNQVVTEDNNTISLKTGDDVNMTFALVGLCLSVLMGWIFIKKSKKIKDE